MKKPIIFSLIESPNHPRLSDLYNEMGYNEMKFSSVRKITGALKKHKPDIIIAQFFFAFASNYASNHICNLDSLLISLQKYPTYKPKFIFFTHKDEYQYLSQLTNHYSDFSISNHGLTLPVTEEKMRELL